MMLQNATAIEDQTTQINELYNNPVIGLDYLEQSYDKLSGAIATANEAMNNSTLKARELSGQLAGMSEKIDPLIKAGELEKESQA